MTDTVIGVIGGSGLYGMAGLTDTEWRRIDSPFGETSDELLFGRLGQARMVFLPRHGRGHRIDPGGINYRANIDAMKRAGCTDIISVSACGSFREELTPGTFVLVDQMIDRTHARRNSFFGEGLVAHVSMADPVCPRLGDALEAAAVACGVPHVRGGVYVTMEGPQFSSRAESHLYRDQGCSVIGMTNMPEAKLAREAELCYATVAMVTDYDCWREDHAHVDVAQVLAVLMDNAEKAQLLLAEAAPRLAGARAACEAGCDRALETAVMTAPEHRDPALLAKLDAVAGRVLG